MERLPPLPLAKAFEIALLSIRVRFFRSLITTLSLVLAVAFLGYAQICNDLANALLRSGSEKHLQLLVQAGYDITPETASIGERAKQRAVVTLSLLVCVVGIVNAQLMAVSERFREIGTMKCLGAMDRVVLLLFVIEAAIQGFLGSLAGAFAGLAAAACSSLVTFGTVIFTVFPLTTIGATMGEALLTGCALSLIGVIFPAIKAARMEPVEAMRTEQ